jgi:hypothetical protein
MGLAAVAALGPQVGVGFPGESDDVPMTSMSPRREAHVLPMVDGRVRPAGAGRPYVP